jgi:DNA-binding transcriptional ArsR family regulator
VGRQGHRRFLKAACESCGFEPTHERQLEIHHVDRDRSNNDPINLRTLCSNCHSLVHAAAREGTASGEQKAILSELRALKRRRNAAAREEKYRLREMGRQLEDLMRVGKSCGLQADEMYHAAGIRETRRAEPQPVRVRRPTNAAPIHKDLPSQLKALADPARLAIVERLCRLEDSPVEPFCEYLQLSQPTVSHHLGILRQAGVIEVACTAGPSTYYRLVHDRIKEIARALAAFNAPNGVARAA